MKHDIKFIASGRGKARCEPDPAYPEGKVMGMEGKFKTCVIDLPYPAPECGWWSVDCADCGQTILITAAGRPDDPRRIILPCNEK